MREAEKKIGRIAKIGNCQKLKDSSAKDSGKDGNFGDFGNRLRALSLRK